MHALAYLPLKVMMATFFGPNATQQLVVIDAFDSQFFISFGLFLFLLKYCTSQQRLTNEVLLSYGDNVLRSLATHYPRLTYAPVWGLLQSTEPKGLLMFTMLFGFSISNFFLRKKQTHYCIFSPQSRSRPIPQRQLPQSRGKKK